MSGTRRGAFWPSHEHELLFRVAFASPAASLRAWAELRPQLDLQTLEGGAFAVLPLVYRALADAGAHDPDVPRLKGIVRSTLTRNALLVERLRDTAAALDAAAAPYLLVGSIGAALRYYPSLGFRPTPYLELLVEEERAIDALRALRACGWSGGARPLRAAAAVLGDDGGNALVLRVGLAPDVVLAGGGTAERAFWERAETIDVRGVPVRALAPGDDLLAAVVTGARWRPGAALDWLLDAAAILRTVPERVDWDRLLGLAEATGQALRLREALAYLRGIGVEVPESVGARLDAYRPSRRERLVYACAGAAATRLGSLPQALAQHLAETAGSSAWGTLVTFPGFLRRRWQLAHGWQVPLAGARRALRASAWRPRDSRT
jgi:hypothetical protein